MKTNPVGNILKEFLKTGKSSFSIKVAPGKQQSYLDRGFKIKNGYLTISKSKAQEQIHGS